MNNAELSPDRASRRLDQWLWFARLVKSRSQAARLCVSGVIAVNDVTITRARHPVRSGDTVVLAGSRLTRKLTVLALGARRGPAAEARQLYEEATTPVPFGAEWTPLLADGPAAATTPLSPEARR